MKYLYALLFFLVLFVALPQNTFAQECPTETSCIFTGSGRTCNAQGGTSMECEAETGMIGDCCIRIPEPTGQPIPPGPIPSEYVPCGGTGQDFTETPEYHSLRPYQASPCLRELAELDLYCGNDLITVKTYDVGPGDATTCNSNDSGGVTCDFHFEEVAEVNIGLDDAELPIMGNTQLVSNQVNGGVPQPERFEWPRLMNEYLSWWLNGTTYTAEDYLHFHPGVRPDVGAIVDFSGPIKKQFPLFVMRVERSAQQVATNTSINYLQRHNQIYMCRVGQEQVPCWYDFTDGRYEDGNGVPVVLTRLVGNGATPESPWMNFTRTEDRLGMVFIDMDILRGFPAQPTGDEGQGATISDLGFTTTVSGDLLYFPHMREGSDLVDHLQKTYVPREIPRSAYVGWGEGMDTYNTYRCDLEDVRWNTGDDLFGEVGADRLPEPVVVPETGEELTGAPISAVVSYSSDFQCDFNCDGRILPDGRCVDDTCYNTCLSTCDPDEVPEIPGIYPDCTSYCENTCASEERCTVDALTASSVYTRTPLSEEIWDRTVSGPVSMMKRILPKIGSSGMFDEWKDWPAVTTANYTVTQVEGGPGTYSTLAGDPNSARDGSRAEIYIPHLGGIKVFAMDILQDTLRPRSMGSTYTGSNNGQLPPGSGNQGGQCSTGTGLCSPANLSPPWSEVEAVTASMICQRESGGSPTALNNDCLRCSDGIDNDGDNIIDLDDPDCDGATADYSVGLFQINLHPLATFTPRCPGAFEMSYAANGTGDNPLRWCNVIDQAALDSCVAFYSDPSNNIDEAYSLFSGNNSFCGNWSTAGPDVCGICPS